MTPEIDIIWGRFVGNSRAWQKLPPRSSAEKYFPPLLGRGQTFDGPQRRRGQQVSRRFSIKKRCKKCRSLSESMQGQWQRPRRPRPRPDTSKDSTRRLDQTKATSQGLSRARRERLTQVILEYSGNSADAQRHTRTHTEVTLEWTSPLKSNAQNCTFFWYRPGETI